MTSLKIVAAEKVVMENTVDGDTYINSYMQTAYTEDAELKSQVDAALQALEITGYTQ